MEFRDHLPLNCPPPDANHSVIEVYCLVDSDPPTSKDFLSQIEKRPNSTFKPELVCQACGLSVFTDVAGVEFVRKTIKKFREKKLARASLSETSGKIKNTPSSVSGDTHHTWWVNRDIDPSSLFKVLP